MEQYCDLRRYVLKGHEALNDAHDYLNWFVKEADPQNDEAEEQVDDIEYLAKQLDDLEKKFRGVLMEIVGDYEEEHDWGGQRWLY